MKNCICLARVCLLILFAGSSSLAQNVLGPAMLQLAQERPRNPQPQCPIISVSCPSDITLGQPLDFNASISGGDPKVTPIYYWEVSGGVIAEGQGTPTIKVNIVGRPGQAVTATLQVDGFDTSCAKTASCSHSNCQKQPPAEKVDSYSLLPINKEKARLDLFAAALKQHPGAQGHILVYSARRSRAGEAQKAVDRAKAYLVNKLGMNEDRIVTVNAGFKEELRVELWLVPMGSIPPAAEPTVDPTEVELIKASANKSAKRPIRH